MSPLRGGEWSPTCPNKKCPASNRFEVGRLKALLDDEDHWNGFFECRLCNVVFEYRYSSYDTIVDRQKRI